MRELLSSKTQDISSKIAIKKKDINSKKKQLLLEVVSLFL